MTRAAGTTPARAELTLSIGGVTGQLELVGGQPIFVQQLRERYEAFLMPPAPQVEHDFSLRIELVPAPPVGARDRFADSAAHPLTVKVGRSGVAAERWDLSAKLAFARGGRRGGARGSARCEMSPFAVDCLLRVIWSTLLPRVGGMLIHGCGLRHAEIGVVFPGQSGAGKTTLARKAPEADDVLSDEIVVVRRTDDGWRLFGTPFWGDFARGGISMRSWPLRTLAFLSQAPNDTVTMTPITSADATLRLLGCFLYFARDAASAAQNLAVAVQLCGEVRSVDASLTRNVSTAQIFRKLAPHLGPEVTRPVPPANAREMISELRSVLRKRQSYAFRPKGSALRPWIKTGDGLLIRSAGRIEPGEIVLRWTPGATPDDDALTCERVGPAGVAVAGEVLGTISAVSRDGRPIPLFGRVGNLGRRFGSLVAMPILRTVGR